VALGSPARSGLQRVIPPWEYRHLRAWARVNFGRALVLGILGLIVLPYAWRWAMLPLATAAVLLAFGGWEMAIDRSARAEPAPAPLAPAGAGRTGSR
jgi:hypothetical protein